MALLLDLFCGAGGASVGYARAGFNVVGVDLSPQPDYPYPIAQADAVEFLLSWLALPPERRARFDAIHASPPCAAYAAITKGTNGGNNGKHPELYEPIRALLDATGLPYVIENPAARPDVVLCGEMFGLGVLRHRRFELGRWPMPQPGHVRHRGRVRGWRHGVFYDGPYVAVYGAGGGKASLSEAKAAMGIDWIGSLCSVTEAIPPAYSELIGRSLLSWLDIPSAV